MTSSPVVSATDGRNVARHGILQDLLRTGMHHALEVVAVDPIESQRHQCGPDGADGFFGKGDKRRLFVPLVLAAFCGLRRGEITAIRWRAIDLDRGQLAVLASTEQMDDGTVREKEAKSGRARTVALPSLAVEELRRWRLVQAQELLRLGIRTDEDWLVVTPSDGSALQPRSLTHVVSAFLKEWGVTLHGLRHSHASHMLASNIHPKVVQERLGHSSIAITMDIYSHLMPNMQGDAADAVDGVLRAAINKRSKDVG